VILSFHHSLSITNNPLLLWSSFHYKRRILCRRCFCAQNLTAKGNGFFALSDKYSEVYLVFMIQVLNFNAEENTNAERKIAYMRFPDIHFRNPGN
jgi:hypothetical protein